jgi:hypothetical protein
MKQLFFIGAIIALASCGGTETNTPIVPTGDSPQWDTTGVDTPFNTDSIRVICLSGGIGIHASLRN